MAEPITIGGQTFVKTSQGWVDQKSKTKAPEGLLVLLNSLQSENSPEGKKKRVRIDTSRPVVKLGKSEYVWDLNSGVWIDKKTKDAVNPKFSKLIEAAYQSIQQGITPDDQLYDKSKIAKDIKPSIVRNMGMMGSAMAAAGSKQTQDKATVERIDTDQRDITSLLISVVQYLSRIDESLKTQTKMGRFVYNQQAISQREQAIEQTSTRVEPDAVPVAANDNEEEKTGSALGVLASGLLITATGLLVANYKSISEKLKSAANMLGLGADVATQQQIEDQTLQSQDLQSAAPRTVAPQAPTSQASPPPAIQRPKSNPISTSKGGSSPSASTNSNRVAASTPFSSTPTAVPPLLARPTATPTQKPETESVGEIPTDIVQLGKYLQKEGYRISGHSQFGGREYGSHSTNSKHYTDNALDVNVGTGIHEASHPVHGPKLDQLAAKLKKAGYSVIWRAAGHHNHLHVQRGGASNVGSGDNEGMFGSEGPIAQSLDSVQESLSRALKHLKPTNLMSRKIGDEALNREMDLMAKPPSTGRQQGHFSKPEAAKIPSPIQQSAAKTGVDVTSQYMFMFFGERPQAASVSNLTQSK